MMAEVRVLGGMRRLLGARSFRVPAPAVRELLDEVAGRGGEGVASAIFGGPDGPARLLHRDLRVLVNGRSIDFLEGLETRLEDSDTVTLHWIGARGFPGG